MSLSPTAADSLNRAVKQGAGRPPDAHPADAYAAWEAADSEAALIDAVLSRDKRAETGFIRRYRPFILAILRRSGLDAGEQEDVAQEVFGRLWEDDHRRLRQWRGQRKIQGSGQENGRFASFLAVVTRRLIYDCYRKKREQPALLSLLEGSPGAIESPREELLTLIPDLCRECHLRQQTSAIRSALKGVAPRDAGLLLRRHVYGESYREIAAAFEMTVNHVGVALARAERRVRARLRDTESALFAEEISQTGAIK